MVRRPRGYVRYAGAVIITAIATVARWQLDAYLGERAPFTIYFVAVAAAGWFGGLGPSLLALALGAVVPVYLFIAPRGTFALAESPHVFGFILYILNGALIGLICATQRSAHVRAEALAEAARKALEAETEERAQREQSEQKIRESEQRFRLLAETMPQIVWSSDALGIVEYLNQRWFEYTGQTPEDAFAPDGAVSAIHEEDREAVMSALAVAIREEGPFEAEFRLRDRSGRYRWQLGRSVPIRDGTGRVVRRFGTTTDIDDRKRAEHDARFLAESGASLAALVDEESALRQVANLAVPFFADWCIVDMAGEGGTIRRLAVAHADPAKSERAADVARRFPPDHESERGIPRVLRSGQPILLPDVSEPMLAVIARNEEHLEILRGLGIRSFLAVPLKGRGETYGVISFLSADSGRRFGPGDLRLAEDLAYRAAIAIENARLYEELKEADRKKDEFLATLAHELRNPLAPVRNALYLMGHESNLAPGFEQERAMLDRQVGHLARLVDDLLDISRISRGKIELRKQPLELAPVVHQAVEATRPFFETKNHQLHISLPDEPILLEADPTRLEQVLWNLLNNAAKYTRAGGRVDLIVTREDDEAVVVVRDTGIGIAPEVLPKIFDMFMQADHHTDRAEGGLGIGLSLVRELVRMHGGAISARSAGLGRGSEFVVRLPTLSALVQRDIPARAPSAAGRLDRIPRRRVLVVDDNVDAAVSLVKVLTRLYGQDVRIAHDGPTALDVARTFQPDVVLLDLGLPGMDGYEVARRLRSEPAGASLLIVAVTGWGQDADRKRTREAGFDHHLVKPVDPDVLHDILADSARHAPA